MENTVNSRDNALNRRYRYGRIAVKTLQYLILTVLGIYLCMPFAIMVLRSFMPNSAIAEGRIFPLASEWTLENFRVLFAENNYFRYSWNTIKIILFNIVAVPLSASICAYSFARIDWKCKKIVFACVMSTIMIPGAVTQVPVYKLFNDLGWIPSLKPMMIPAAFGGGAINIFLLRQFMRNVSKEIDEAAKVDGANLFHRYAFIMLPLCGPILLYVMVGTFSSAWSDFYGPLVYLGTRSNDPQYYTLAVAIYKDSFNDTLNKNSLRMAAGTFMSALPAVIFIVYQRKLVDGIMVGAVKG